MSSSKLMRIINSIGKACFIEHFELIMNSNLSKNVIIEQLMNLGKYSENGAKTRINCAKRILKNNLIREILEIIIESKKVTEATRNKARKLKIIYM